MANCYRCGEYNPHRAKYCMFCGHDLAIRSFKFDDNTLSFYLKKSRDLSLKYAVVIIFASFFVLLAGLVYSFGYYNDYFGKMIFIALLIFFISSIAGIIYYHAKRKKIRNYLKNEQYQNNT